MSIFLISHDLGVIARMADRIGVMYAGKIVECGDRHDIFDDQLHPYTWGLIQSTPNLHEKESELDSIEGNVPDLIDENMPRGCNFADRCPKAMEECREEPPELDISSDHRAKCFLVEGDNHPSKRLEPAAGTPGGETDE